MPKMRIEFEFETDADGFDKATALLKYADKLGVPSVPDEPKGAPPAPAAGKGKPAPAAKGKPPAAAAKANSKTKPKEPEQADIMDFTGDDEEDDEETGGLGLADDDAEENGFDGTAEEAREEALARLRTMLGNGLKPQVKQVQQIMKVAKFHDVPVDQGFEFLKAVKEVEAKIAKN